MSLRDEAVYACSLREPQVPESMKHHLNDPDRAKLGGLDHLTHLPLFKDERPGFAKHDAPVQGPSKPLVSRDPSAPASDKE